jgi:hypothetical protein
MNIFRQLEFALKVAFGDALIQVGTFFLLGRMGAFDDQQIILRGDLQFALGKTGHGNSDAVVVFVYQLNVIRRVAAITLALIVF